MPAGSGDPAGSRPERAVSLVEANGAADDQEAPVSPERAGDGPPQRRGKKNSGGRSKPPKSAGQAGDEAAPGDRGVSGIVSEDPDLAVAGNEAVGLAEVADLADLDPEVADVELAEDGLDSAELEDFDVAAVDVDLEVAVDVDLEVEVDVTEADVTGADVTEAEATDEDVDEEPPAEGAAPATADATVAAPGAPAAADVAAKPAGRRGRVRLRRRRR